MGYRVVTTVWQYVKPFP